MLNRTPRTATSYLLSFHEEIVDELLERDGLTVMAEGLGLSETLAGIIRALPRATAPLKASDSALATLLLPSTAEPEPSRHASGESASTSVTGRPNEKKKNTSNAGCSLILGLNDAQKRALRVHLKRLAPDTPFPEITADFAGVDRRKAYDAGGPMFVTTRIAAVDILSERLPPTRVAGLVVGNAHRVTDFSGEAFVARLFRAGNRLGFVRGLTDRPGDLVRGFNGVERAMKALMVRRVNLWPRFHLGVRACLDKHAPEVVELRQPLSPATRQIQDAIVEVMRACMSELRRSRHVDTSELTVEAGLHKSFDRVLQRQLDPVWHSVSRKLKQIVYDLRTLRNLATYLLRYDAVTFLRYLETLRVAEGASPSGCTRTRRTPSSSRPSGAPVLEKQCRRRGWRRAAAARRRRARRRDGDRRARGGCARRPSCDRARAHAQVDCSRRSSRRCGWRSGKLRRSCSREPRR